MAPGEWWAIARVSLFFFRNQGIYILVLFFDGGCGIYGLCWFISSFQICQLRMVIFRSYVSLPEGSVVILWYFTWDNAPKYGKASWFISPDLFRSGFQPWFAPWRTVQPWEMSCFFGGVLAHTTWLWLYAPNIYIYIYVYIYIYLYLYINIHTYIYIHTSIYT